MGDKNFISISEFLKFHEAFKNFVQSIQYHMKAPKIPSHQKNKIEMKILPFQ